MLEGVLILEWSKAKQGFEIRERIWIGTASKHLTVKDISLDMDIKVLDDFRPMKMVREQQFVMYGNLDCRMKMFVLHS